MSQEVQGLLEVRTILCTRICCIGTQRAMPEAQSTWTKGIGAESNQQHKYSNEVLEPKPKDGNVHLAQTPPSVENQGLITQD